MEQFLVSARKYRPASFDTVVGQEHITETLLNEIKQNRLAQAFLFTGPRGVGKTTCARILARVINTQADPSIDPNYDFAFNIFELDAASNNSVDDIRQLVEQVRIPPQIGKYKVYIIDEVHMLSSNAFNAFLKTLEEPPAYAIFILATTERHKILPTILSRCQIFNFKRIEPTAIVAQLKTICEKEGISAEDQALHIIAQKADGGLRDALSMFDQMVSFSKDKKLTYAGVIENLNVLDHNYYFEVTQSLNAADYGKVLIKFDEVLANGFDGQYFLNGLASHFRDLLVVKNTATAYLISGSEQMLPLYKSQADKMTAGFLLNAINIADQFDQTYKASRNQRLHVELALIKMANINAAINLAEELKKKSLELSSDTPKTTSQQANKDATPKPSSDSGSKPPSTLRMGNLGNMVNNPTAFTAKKPEDPEAKPEPKTTEELLKIAAEPQNASSLKEIILDFAEVKKLEGKKFSFTLLKELTAEEQDDKLIVTLTNTRDQNEFDEIKTDFLRFVNDRTGKSYQIELKIEKVAQKILKVYTNKDKFTYLAEQNPFLIEFSMELGLDLE
jgi:DNA polymerase-3 subunit gamma/tau